ncbi:MFS transporter [Streptacidiphilus fuscans]|uniref:MFS transporter n=1 Tax=Streptacidiphilus fuscans TaxID=2789292 RepID=A0A931FE77_9ACTN|nr:MFS transporter [Streptacidiphilus fuscans]MBF9068346.1 MFS transporter [Streptacidiphilus fuscans]
MRKWIPLAAVCLGAFMLLVDVSIVNVALPKMAADLNSSFTSLQWVVDIYALTLAALLMALGSLGDRVGHRRLYLTGLVVFAAASLACGLAPNAATLITARAVQGIGGAAMMTSTTALLASAYHGRDRGTAFGVWGAVNGAAAAVGPVLGGLLLSAAAFAELTYTSLWLQEALRLSPLSAGLAVSPMALSAFVVALVSGKALHKVTPQLPIGIGLLLIGGGTMMLAAVTASSGWTALLPGLLITGVGVGLSTPTLMSTALAAVPPARAGMASGALNTARQLGYALGIAVLGTIFQGHFHGSSLRASYASGLDLVYLTAGGTGIVAGLLVLALVRRHVASGAAAVHLPEPRSEEQAVQV